jgi:hypothetical protein
MVNPDTMTRNKKRIIKYPCSKERETYRDANVQNNNAQREAK